MACASVAFMEMQVAVPSESGVSIGYGLVDSMQLLLVGCKAYQSCSLKLSTCRPPRSSEACRWSANCGSCKLRAMFGAVILLDWSGVDLTPKSTPYAKKLMELQDSNAALDQIYTINSKS